MAVSPPLENPHSIEPICRLRFFSLSVSLDDSYLQIPIQSSEINPTFFKASVSSIIFYACALEKDLAYSVFWTLGRRRKLLRSGRFPTELAGPGANLCYGAQKHIGVCWDWTKGRLYLSASRPLFIDSIISIEKYTQIKISIRFQFLTLNLAFSLFSSDRSFSAKKRLLDSRLG